MEAHVVFMEALFRSRRIDASLAVIGRFAHGVQRRLKRGDAGARRAACRKRRRLNLERHAQFDEVEETLGIIADGDRQEIGEGDAAGLSDNSAPSAGNVEQSTPREHLHRLADSEAADLILSGQILSVIMPTLSFSRTTTLESRTEVVVVVKVEETRTKRVVWTQTAKGASEFFVTTDLQFNRVLQNRALEQAGRFIAEDLASRFLLQLESGQLTKPSLQPASDNEDAPGK